MNQSKRENGRGAEPAHSDDDWLVAYENHVVQGGPAPGDFPEDLSDADKRELADARRAIDALHGVFTQGRTAAEPANAEQPPKHLGDFRILREIGRGGMGVVYEAEQISLPRRVALKILPFAAVLDPRQLERFKNEARAAATLHHPGIVAVYSVGAERGVHFFAMQFIEGQSLAEVIDELQPDSQVEKETTDRTVDDTEAIQQPASTPSWQSHVNGDSTNKQAFFHRIARLGMQAAAALDHAHTRGIVHRDVKPGNLLLDTDGQIHVADFGLARMGEDAGITMTGDVLGTLRYMSPEQALARRAVIDHRTDIYSLGATLYELLTLRPLFQGHDRQELLHKIALEEPPQPGKLNARIPADLETIVLKAISKDPTDRYDTAQSMADDLDRYIDGKPVQARRINAGQRLWRWSKRNPMVAALSISVIAVLMLGLSWHNYRLSKQLAVSDRLRIEAADNAREFLRARYVADMQLTQQALSKGRYSEARSRLEKYQPGSDGAKVTDFAWHLLSAQLQRSLVDFDQSGPFTILATSDVLGISVTGGEDGMLRIFATTTGKQLALTQAHDGNINGLAFAANGTTMASGGDDGVLSVWDLSSVHDHGSMEMIVRRKAHQSDLFCIAFAPDGKLLASGSADKTVRLWELETLKPAGELTGHTDWVRSLDFSPDGITLASASDDETIRRWNLETEKEIDRFVGHEKYVLSVKHHPTEPLIVSGGKDRTIRFWDLTTGEERQQLSVLNGWVRSLCFSADGNRIAVAGDDPRVVLLERTASGQYEQTKVIFTNRSGNQATSFANSDGQIVSAGSAGASAWSFGDPLRGEKLHVTNGGPQQIIGPSKEISMALVTSHRLITADFGTDSVRDIRLNEEKQYGSEVAISTEGNLIALREYEDAEHSDDQRIFVTDGKGENKRVLLSGFGKSYGMDVSPTGNQVAAATPDGIIRIWQGPDFQETVVRTPFESHFDSFLIDQTGKRLYLLPENNSEMTILDVATSEPVAKLPNAESLLNRSADGRFLAIAMTDYSVAIYDTLPGTTIQTLPSHASNVVGGAFSPIEPLLATITNGGEITLWALDTGEMLTQFQAAFCHLPAKGACLGFASDGRTLVAAGGYIGEEHLNLNYSEIRSWRVP